MLKSKSKAKKHETIIMYAIFIFFTVLCLFPFFMLIINSTRMHSEIQKGFSAFPGKSLIMNLRNVFNNQNLPVLSGLRNSLFIAAFSALFATYFGGLTAYGIHAYNFKGKKAAFSFILFIMLVPAQVSALGFLRQMLAMGLRDSFIPLILPSVAAPAVVFFMRQFMESSVPLEIIEAARIDGANEFYGYNKIIVPLLRPAIAVQGIFSFVGSWNNYFMPSLLIDSDNKKTLPILIAQLRSADFLKFDEGQVYMLIFLAIIPTVIVYLVLSKNIVGGIALGGVKG